MDVSKIKQVKNEADILKVVGHFVQLKKDGANYVGSCPFHTERSNSFVVSKSKNIFKCFGCGEHGDVLDFVMKKQSSTVGNAIKWIVEFHSLTLSPEYKVNEYVEPPTSFIDPKIYHSSIKSDKPNNFTDWLNSIFPTVNIIHPISTSKHWIGSVTFWYIDVDKNIRSGKIMQYNRLNGKRVKEPKPLVTWVHRVLKLNDFNVQTCLYGEHLLNEFPDKTVAIVESEKTAIVASIKYPRILWIASGSLSNLTARRCEVLKGRNVLLYPDVGAEDRWIEKANQLSEFMPDTKFEVRPLQSDIKGYDLCDYIIDQINK